MYVVILLTLKGLRQKRQRHIPTPAFTCKLSLMVGMQRSEQGSEKLVLRTSPARLDCIVKTRYLYGVGVSIFKDVVA